MRWLILSRSDVGLPNFLWMNRKTPERIRQMNPTPTYATPRNEFFPPSQLVLDIIKDLVPLKGVTGGRRGDKEKCITIDD